MKNFISLRRRLPLCVLALFLLGGCHRGGMITDSELNSMELPFVVGDQVSVQTGPWKGQIGSVEAISGLTGGVLYVVRVQHDTLDRNFISSFRASSLSQKTNTR